MNDEYKKARAQAEVDGFKVYEGKPCIHGHGRMRYVKHNSCIECGRLRSEYQLRKQKERKEAGLRRDESNANINNRTVSKMQALYGDDWYGAGRDEMIVGEISAKLNKSRAGSPKSYYINDNYLAKLRGPYPSKEVCMRVLRRLTKALE